MFNSEISTANSCWSSFKVKQQVLWTFHFQTNHSSYLWLNPNQKKKKKAYLNIKVTGQSIFLIKWLFWDDSLSIASTQCFPSKSISYTK